MRAVHVQAEIERQRKMADAGDRHAKHAIPHLRMLMDDLKMQEIEREWKRHDRALGRGKG